jgi:hypothetical protein
VSNDRPRGGRFTWLTPSSVANNTRLKPILPLIAHGSLICYFTRGAGAAVEVAKRLGPGHSVATILCDSGLRYAGKLFSRKFLKSKGLLDQLPDSYQSALLP